MRLSRPCSCALLLGASLAALSAVPAQAQELGATTEQEPPAEDIVVTGSLIPGAAEDGPSPVDVLNGRDLEQIGSPTITELTRLLPVSSGTDGETNQFVSGSLEGTSNINLRGLGPARTLVLLNGRRVAQSGFVTADGQAFVDTNLIPAAAVGRIEILKDGAAALYGSDAIAGVVNFITDRRLRGIRVSGDFEKFEGTDGEYGAAASVGLGNDRTSWVTSFGYQHRSEVNTREKDWTTVPASISFENGYSGTGNPGVLRQVGGAAATADPGCAVVGGTPGPGSCLFQFIPFDNLVETEDRYQLFSELSHRFSSGIEFRLEGLFARTDIPEWKTSPAYPPQRPTNFVPANHPGLVALLAANPQLVAANPFLQPAALAAAGGINWTGRAFGWGGFPGSTADANGAQTGNRQQDTFRIAGSLEGQFGGGIGWNVAATYQEVESSRLNRDIFVTRFAQAIRGFGGPGCTGTTPGANGCQYYNPFSNAIPAGRINGQTNPGFVPALANSPELADWLVGDEGAQATTELLVLDAVVNGRTGIDLGGGPIGFAVGLQYRRDGLVIEARPNSDFSINPCPTPGDQSCISRTGVFGFLGPTVPSDESRDVKAVFAELDVPVTPQLQAQLAARYEDYGGRTGSTFNPKGALRWEPVTGVVLRGSAGTTFRGPQLSQISGQGTALQFLAPAGAFKAVDNFGNPDLQPESAFSFNVGLVVERGGFRASIDYFNFRFEDPIIVEPFNFIVGDVLTGIASGRPSPLQNRVTFVDINGNGRFEGGEIERVRTQYINGPKIKTDGVDVAAEYGFDLGPGRVRFGGEASYQFNYDVGAVLVEGRLVSQPFDGIGNLNANSFFVRPLPQWKGLGFLEFGGDRFNARYVVRHVDSYLDQRFEAVPTAPGRRIRAQTTHDLYLWARLPQNITASASVINIFDKDPPFARLNLNYDPFTHSPFGRTFKLTLKKQFDFK